MTEQEQHEEIRDNLFDALQLLINLSNEIAKHYNVCPLCLTYALEAATKEAEDKGLIQHAGKEIRH